MAQVVLTPRRSNGRRYIPMKVEASQSFSRPLTEEEILAIYNEGQPVTEIETENKEPHPCARLTAQSPIELGQTELICKDCVIADCLTDDPIWSPFYGFSCTVCGKVTLVRETDDFLECRAFCKYGRPIIVYLTTCESCRDYVEGMTMGAFRPFRERKS